MDGTDTLTRRKPGIFFGWYVVAAAAAINVYGAGVWFYGFPIFFKALRDEFAWTAAGAAAIISLSRLEGGLEGPIIGWLVDKYGPRRLAVIGAVMAGLGFFAMSRVDALNIGSVHVSAFVAFAVLYAGWMSIGYNTGFGHASQAAVNAWFIRLRSRAFALFSLGAGGSGATVVALGWAVDRWGWRDAAFMAGVGIFIIVIPLSLLLRHKPEQYGYLPDGDEPVASPDPAPEAAQSRSTAGPDAATEPQGSNGATAAAARGVQHDYSVKETLLTVSFWMLVLGSAARSVAMTSIVIHEVVYLTEVRNINLTQASSALGAMVFISMVGRMAFGTLGDFVDKRFVLIVTYVLQAVGIYILANVTNMAQVWIFVVVYGIAYGGAIPVFMAIVGEYYGRQYFATIRGFLQLFLVPTTVLGPVFAGLVYDRTGSYQIAFMSFIVALLVGTVFVFLSRKPTPRATGSRAGEGATAEPR